MNALFESDQLDLIDLFYSKKCTEKRRETLERLNISTVTDALTETSVSHPTKVDTKKFFANCSVCCKSLQESSVVSSESNSCSTCGSHICKNRRNCSIFSVKSNAFLCSYCYELDKYQDSYDGIFESLNRTFSNKIITKSELSTKQNGTGNAENNVMLESNGNFYNFNLLNIELFYFHSPL